MASLAATLLACGQGPITLSRVIGPDVDIAGPAGRPFAGNVQILSKPGGVPDLYVVGSVGPGPLWRVAGAPDRTYGEPEAIHESVLSGPQDLGDVDGDGERDLGLIVWRDDRAWASYGRVEAGAYVRTSPWELQTVGFLPDMDGIGDWTGNGHLDLAMHLSDAVSPARTAVLEGSPTGPALPPVWSDSHRWNISGATDADGDGRNEVSLNAGGGSSTLLRYQSDGTVREERLIVDGARPAGDVDGDGRTDFRQRIRANADQRGAVELYLGPVDDPDPWWRLETWDPCSENVADRSTCFEGDRFRNIWSLDFNGDGHMDVIVSAVGPSELMSRGVAAIFEGRKGRPPKKTPTWVLAAVDDDAFFDPAHSGDLDGDGMDDVVAVASDCDNPLACDAIGGTVYIFFGREERP